MKVDYSGYTKYELSIILINTVRQSKGIELLTLKRKPTKKDFLRYSVAKSNIKQSKLCKV